MTPNQNIGEPKMKNSRTFTIGLLFGLFVTILIAATSTKQDDSENQCIGKYQMSINSEDRIFIINTATGRVYLLNSRYNRMPTTRWIGFEGPEAEKALREMQEEREKRELENAKRDEIAKPRLYYDLFKVWMLQATIEKDGDTYAVIMDKGKPDRRLKKPYTIYEVRKGDIIESSDHPRIFKVEILDVKKNYLKYYRHDMDDRTKEERTFEMSVWPNSD
jgi:hypothetical protein